MAGIAQVENYEALFTTPAGRAVVAEADLIMETAGRRRVIDMAQTHSFPIYMKVMVEAQPTWVLDPVVLGVAP